MRPETPESLRAQLGEPGDPARHKAIGRLDEHCRGILAASPFVVVATSAADGSCDASPRGGPPGFVRVLDDHRLAIGELPGNRLFDGAGNLAENPQAALLVMIPGTIETLRIEGRAYVSTEPELRTATAIDGREPWGALVVEVTKVFAHCGKALKRSRLWEPDSWLPADRRPRMAAVLAAHIAMPGPSGRASSAPTAKEVEESLTEAYEKRLWEDTRRS